MKRILLSIVALLLLATPIQAAGEFQLLDKSLSGQTLYVLLFSGAGEADAGEAWDGDSWEPLTDTWANFDVAMTEVSTTGNFLGTMPAIGNKSIRWVIYQDANDDATPSATTDIALADGSGQWATDEFSADLDIAELVALVLSLLPPENDENRTWVMRRGATGKILEKTNEESAPFWADVSRLLGDNETITGVTSVTASGITTSAISYQGGVIEANFAGGSVSSTSVNVVFTFTTNNSGAPIVATGRMEITD